MKTYKLTKKNWDKVVGDCAVVFEKDCDNLKIIGSAQVIRDFNGKITLVPKVQIGDRIYSPSMLSPDEMREDYGWKTFSI